MMRTLRSLRRATLGALAFPFLAGAVFLQSTIVEPLFKNKTAIPNFVYNTMRRLIGIKVEFNEASAPLEKDKPTWFVMNHMSMADPVVAGAAIEGNFVGKGEVLKWPVIGPLAKSMKLIGVRRSREFNAQSMAKIANNFNKGENVIMFPEGTTNDGATVDQFRAGLISLLFGAHAEDKDGKAVALEKDVMVQPVAIRVKEVEGKPATDSDELRRFYSYHNVDNMVKRVWNRMGTKSLTLEFKVFPAMNPKDYANQFDLINAAHKQVQEFVAPNQTEVKKGVIPYNG
ncbi:MAG: 1-acyl-sn-glycerol-3-phosphate acyltransferase [Alphaproteobacteria bacterium]|nr:1-acyl-sn-glycerol-3-phosphate acyltransferase [Alphaproteobacteria bacterium]